MRVWALKTELNETSDVKDAGGGGAADVNTRSVCGENQSGELQRRRELTSFLTSHSSAGPDAARGDPEEHEEERGLAWDGVGDEEEDAEVEEKKKEEEEG